RALKKRPEERPQTASAMAQELLAAVHNHQTLVIDQNAAVEKSSEKSNLESTHTTRNGNGLVLVSNTMIFILSVAAGFGRWRYFKNDRNGQMSIAPVVIRNDQAAAPAPELKTDQPTNPTPDAPGGKTTTNIETKPSLPRGNQPVGKNAAETP